MIPGWSPTKVVQMVLIDCRSRSRGQKVGFQMLFSKIFSSETTRPRAFIYGILHHLEVPYQSCSNAPGSKLTPPRGHNFTLNYIRKSSKDIFSWTANGNLTKLNRNGPWLFPYQKCSNGPIGCICRARGQKVGFQNAIFKNLLVCNYKAKSIHIWYIASSRGPLPKLFKLCPWG